MVPAFKDFIKAVLDSGQDVRKTKCARALCMLKEEFLTFYSGIHRQYENH